MVLVRFCGKCPRREIGAGAHRIDEVVLPSATGTGERVLQHRKYISSARHVDGAAKAGKGACIAHGEQGTSDSDERWDEPAVPRGA
jgi:hypothetical protein